MAKKTTVKKRKASTATKVAQKIDSAKKKTKKTKPKSQATRA